MTPVADGPGRLLGESPRCYLCSRDTSDEDYLNLTVRGNVERCCSTCWEKGDEGIDIPLDMTRDEDAGND